MANVKIPDLPASSGLADVDLFETVDDPAGTPVSQKATALQIATYTLAKVSDQTEATSMDEATDFLGARVGGATRKVSPATILASLIGLTNVDTSAGIDGANLVIIATGGLPRRVVYSDFFRGIVNLSEETTSLALTSVLPLARAASTPRKVTVETLLKALDLLTAFAGTIDGAADKLLYWDADAGAIRSITPDVLFSGRQTVAVPAGAWRSRTTNGPADGAVELGTNKIMVVSKDFDASTQEYCQLYCWFPKSWDLSNLAFRVAWTTATGSGGVAWSLAGRAYADDDALDQAMGTATIVTDTRLADNDNHISAESGSVAVAGGVTEMDFCILEFSRAVANAGDTKTGDAKMMAVHLYYNTRFRSDA